MITINIAIMMIMTIMMSNRLSVDKGNWEPVVAEQLLNLASHATNLVILMVMMVITVMMVMMSWWSYGCHDIAQDKKYDR